MNLELLRPKETETMRTVKKRKSEIIAAREAAGDKDAMFTVNEAIADYAKRMQTNHGKDCQKVEAYHALVGSGIPIGVETIPDFDGEDSVMKLLEELDKETV